MRDSTKWSIMAIIIAAILCFAAKEGQWWVVATGLGWLLLALYWRSRSSP